MIVMSWVAVAGAADWLGLGGTAAPGVIVPAAAAPSEVLPSGATSATPTAAQVAGLELALTKTLAGPPDPRHRGLEKRLPADRPGYHAQYTGWTVDGHHLVHGNYLYDPTGTRFPSWRSAWQRVSDGGNNYFDVVYDATTDEVVQLMVNGEA